MDERAVSTARCAAISSTPAPSRLQPPLRDYLDIASGFVIIPLITPFHTLIITLLNSFSPPM